MKQNTIAPQVTMKNVADLAGVSTATVSRALMLPEEVANKTRNKIEQEILQTGYIPQPLAISH